MTRANAVVVSFTVPQNRALSAEINLMLFVGLEAITNPHRLHLAQRIATKVDALVTSELAEIDRLLTVASEDELAEALGLAPQGEANEKLRAKLLAQLQPLAPRFAEALGLIPEEDHL